MSRFTSVLVANRGEIACRVIRTARLLGYRTVAVYSDADAQAPHVVMADQAVHIGASPVGQSYLLADKIITAAQQSGAEAIHPGYGFLSENADFAKACQSAGLVFIGPSADAIEVMGNKAESKRRMLAADVPCVPGYEGENQSESALLEAAEQISLPIMVKAAAGGGGRGMRLVEDNNDLANAIKLARSEAENAFGSGELILEKAIIEPRHVEVQVFADEFGNTVHFGERDCSVQRRHQKVIEEAPCPIMSSDLRAQMGGAAVAAARSINYVGAGTVEFLLDSQGEFYFLEMNTRLQVEHPVTELITGLDLVELQLQVAQGQELGISQEEVSLSGHAIEVRLYSEDPAMEFLPTAGKINKWKPASGEGIRIDAGICSGQEVSPYYDPMLAKIIASGPSREVARLRLIKALEDTSLFGVKNNKAFLIDCLKKQSFIDGRATTAFISQEFDAESLQSPSPTIEQMAMAAVLSIEKSFEQHQQAAVFKNNSLQNWSSAGLLQSRVEYQFDQQPFSLTIEAASASDYQVCCLESNVMVRLLDLQDETACMEISGKRYYAHYQTNETGVAVSFAGRSWQFEDQLQFAGVSGEGVASGRILAPMHGLVLQLNVEEGATVTKGQSLLILEAMKMQHEILATVDGVVVSINAEGGSQVSADDLLIEIDG